VLHVYDHMPGRAAAFAGAMGANVAGDLKAVLADAAVKAVMIFAETDLHDQLIDAAIDAGKHVYVDKPLALTAKGAYRLAGRLERSGLIFSTGFVLRRRSHHMFLRQQIAAGAFGRITRIRHTNGNTGAISGHFHDEHLQWFTRADQAGGGGFLDEGTHSADMLLWLLGAKATRVTAVVSSALGCYPGCDEFGQGLIEFDNGAIGTISGSWVDPVKTVSMEVSGTEGAAWVVGDKHLFVQTPKLPGADGQTPWKDMPVGHAHPQQVFLEALQGKASGDLATPRQAADAAAVIATMMQAAKQGVWLNVPGGE
jgi:predicted dehydrogenase